MYHAIYMCIISINISIIQVLYMCNNSNIGINTSIMHVSCDTYDYSCIISINISILLVSCNDDYPCINIIQV